MVNHGIPMRKDKKTYVIPSDSYEERKEKPMVKHQIPMERLES